MYREGPNIEQVKAAAKNGDPNVAFDLGWCYYIGNGVGRDTTEARKWYSEAAQGGVREADEILHILEAEAQRASELKSLKQQEKQAALRGHRATWVLVVVLVAVSVASVGTLVHVLNRDSAVFEERPGLGREESVAQGPETTLVDEATDDVATAREEAVAQGPETTSIDKGTDDVATVREEASIQEKLSELKTQTSPPNGLSRERDKAFDFNDVVRFAEKWLGSTDRTDKLK